MVFLDLVITPGGVAAWLAAGLLAGWLAGKLMADVSYGVIGELLLGMAGAVSGGLLLGLLVGDSSVLLGLLAAFGAGCMAVAVGRVVVSFRNV